MSGTTDRLRNSFRELGPKVEWIAARLLDRIEAECPELSSLAAVARVSGVGAVAQFLAVVARSDGVPEAVGRYLDGAEDWVQAWGLTDQHVAVAREVLLETLAEASGGDWDVETESAWAEALEAVDARLRSLVTAGPPGRRTVRQAESVRQTESAEPPGVGRPGRRVPGGETPAETPSMLTDTMTPPRVAENGASAATEALPQPTADASRADARTRELVENSVAVQAVLESATRARSVSEAITAALDTVREKFGWAYGSYWALDRKENVLRFSTESGSVNAEFRQVTERATFAEGVGLSGRAWRQRDLVFVPDLAQVGDCVRAPAARRAGVKSGVCFPLIVGGEVIGTMDFFSLSTLTLSKEREGTLRSVGRLVSSALESLETAARYKSMLDGLPANVILADEQFRITYLNPASLRQLKAIEKLLPVRADQVLGKSIDIFHKNPSHQRAIVGDPSNLPHRTRFQLGPETLDLLVSAVRNSEGEYLGPMVTWSVVTEQVRLADAFEKDVKGVAGTVGAAASEVQAGSRNMAAVTEETARQAQVVAAAGEQTTRNVQTVSAATEELSASIAEIARHVQEASKMTSEAVREADRTNVTVKELGEASSQIGQVVKVISSIAQQTNLLALNATIEAARAGEAGKGFAVVANEVKELARQTAKATEEISQKIAAIQSSTGVAVRAIETIGGRIGKIDEIATTIAAAVEEQTAATNEISRNVAEAARGTAEVSGNITAVSQAAAEGGKNASEMLSAADRLSAASSKLTEAVDAFLARMRQI